MLLKKELTVKIPSQIVDRIEEIKQENLCSLNDISREVGISNASGYNFFYYKRRTTCRPYILQRIENFIRRYDDEKEMKKAQKEMAINGNK